MTEQNLFRAEYIKIYVTKEEKEIIKKNMNQAGEKTLTNFVRRSAIYGHIINIDFSDLRQFMGGLGKIENELNHIGNNINQIAKKANENDQIDMWEFSSLRDDIFEIRELYRNETKQQLEKIWSYIKLLEQE